MLDTVGTRCIDTRSHWHLVHGRGARLKPRPYKTWIEAGEGDRGVPEKDKMRLRG